jgi:threonine/homoserine/homoserine lactone efflux protein
MSYSLNLWLYFVLLLGIILVPGMDMLFVLTNTLLGGRNLGLSAVAGIMAGGTFHTLMGLLVVGFLLILPPLFFTLVVFAGAAYMGWIGLTLVRSSITLGSLGAEGTHAASVAFRRGLLTCVLNPKAHLFVVAVYPQFMKPQYGALWSQALVMGAMTLLTQFSVYGGLALAAAKARDFLAANSSITVAIGRAAGVLFMGVAVLTAWHGWNLR